jgi:hypothetical protein
LKLPPEINQRNLDAKKGPVNPGAFCIFVIKAIETQGDMGKLKLPFDFYSIFHE